MTDAARGTRGDFVALLAKGRLAENVLHFVRVLRAAGLPVGPARVIDALAAVEAVGLQHREDFRASLAAVLVSRQEHLTLFDQAFDLFWRDPKLLERIVAASLPKVYARLPEDEPHSEVPARLAQALLPRHAAPEGEEKDNDIDLDAGWTFSAREVLQHKDFASMTADELAEVKKMLAKLRLPLPALPARRTERAIAGRKVDLRATLRGMTGASGVLAPLRYRRPVRRPPPLVVLCDISGSMDRYARMLLHFLHAITNDRHRVQVLLFGTRLTNITRQLRHRDVDVALERVTAAVADWSGGTRIGVCLGEFNRRWSRRLLGQNAVVLLISDGLDADAGAGLAFEMERVAKSSRRVVWLNPLLRFEGFEARPAGIRAMLPYVDDFRPVHNVASLTELARALSPSTERGRRRMDVAGRRRLVRVARTGAL